MSTWRKKQQERRRKRQNLETISSTAKLVELVGNQDTEIPDDIINEVLQLMKDSTLVAPDLCVGFFTPAEIHLMVNSGCNYQCERQIPLHKNCLLIHPLIGHWVTSFYDANFKKVSVYDSLQTDHHFTQIKEQIAIIYGTDISKTLYYVPIPQQSVLPICGVMALAYAVSLLLGINPSSVEFDLEKARNHLKSILVNRIMMPFPTKTQGRNFSENILESIFTPQLDLYFKDQNMKSSLKKNAEKSVLVSLHTAQQKPKSRQSMDTQQSEKERNRFSKQKRRLDPEYREMERAKDRLLKEKARKSDSRRIPEKQKDREYRQKIRSDITRRIPEKQKEKYYKQRVRQDVERRIPERQKDKLYRQSFRQDIERRIPERQKEKKYRQNVRRDVEKRIPERQKDKQYRHSVRQDVERRIPERQKDKQYRQKVRQDAERRIPERQKDKQYRKTVRQDAERRIPERQKDKQYRKTVRQDAERRIPERQKDKQYRKTVRQDAERRIPERQKDKQYRKTVRQDAERRIPERQKDKNYRQTIRQDIKRRVPERQNDKQYRQRLREDVEMRVPERQKDKEYRQTVRQNLERRNTENSQRKLHVLQKRKDINYVVESFQQHCKQLPSFVCSICYRYLFRKQVKNLRIEKFEKQDYIKKCIDLNELHHQCEENCTSCALWICFTCERSLSQNKFPNQSSANKLSLPEQPLCLSKLNQLEKHLISPIIPFMKILPLPKSLQKGLHGPVVCVPSNLSKIVEILPRDISDDTLIKVKLKRKLQYKGHHMFQQISMQKIKSAIQCLKDVNPHFSDVTLDMSVISTNDESGLVVNDLQIESTAQLPDQNDDRQHRSDADAQESTAQLPDQNDDRQHRSDADAQADLTETSAPMISCLQPEQLQAQDHPDDCISLAPAEEQRPCSVFQEMKVFPYLFPEGIHGYSEERCTKLGLGRYINCRLFSKDKRFASDPQYIFFSQYISELQNIQSSTSIAMRKGAAFTSEGRKITADMLTNVDQRSKILSSDKGYQFLKTIRGSPAYWEKCMKDLFAMVRMLGVPTWFCSFSAADRRWPEILEAICKQQNITVPEDLDWSEYCRLINSDPVTACRMFVSRVEAFITDVILSPAQPIGNVVDYFYRTEFQSRGWPHIHCLFWCKDAPKFDGSGEKNEEFMKFIDKYVSCEVPNSEEDIPLYEIVSSVQMHSKKHSKTCKKGSKECRFNFPRPVSLKTFVAVPSNGPDDIPPGIYKQRCAMIISSVKILSEENAGCTNVEEIFQKLDLDQEKYEEAICSQTSRNVVIFKRNINDQWVNPYNASLLKAWNGNMDIQPVLDAYSCIMYIVSYISKAERELGDLLRRAQQEAEEGHLEPIKQLRKLGNVYLQSREISVMEAIYRACGLKLKQCSREVVYVPTDRNAARITKPLHVLMNSDDPEDIWMTSILDRYHCRPTSDDFQNMTLADFVSLYRIVTRKSATSNSDEDPPKQAHALLNNKGSVAKRTVPAVPRYSRYNKDKQSEDYYYNLIVMYLPHRGQLETDDSGRFELMFHKHSSEIISNMGQYECLTEELDAAWQRLQEQGPPDDSWDAIISNQEAQRREDQEELDIIRRELLENSEEIEEQDIPDLTVQESVTCSATNQNFGNLNVTKFNQSKAVQKLNPQQLKLFQFISDWAECKENGYVQPFHIFLTGGAGTGKSHTIRCIFNEVDRTITRSSENAESPVVLLVAYTGTAAYNIGGQTIHSAFSINHSQYLSEDSANTLRSKLIDLQLLIIDEISMVSTDILNLIHCRLQQIKRPTNLNAVFGNISVLAVGDFYQVPPVRGKSLLSSNKSLTDLWSVFQIYHLTEIIRQKGDATFTNLLNRLRIRTRNQDLCEEDQTFLQKRMIAKEDPNYPKNILHIAATHKQLDIINSSHIEQLAETEIIHDIVSVDICHDNKTQKSFKRNSPLDIRNTVLPHTLRICVGARVMLTQNLDVADGLTNGAIGTVTSIIKGQMSLGIPTAICVIFDNEKVGIRTRTKVKPPPDVDQNSTVIKLQTEVIQRRPYQVTRHQFPFILAWAVTIHKVQGLTADKAIVSLKGIFKPCMGYVALSRVTSGDGLYLLDEDFDLSVVYCDPKVTSQLDSMQLLQSSFQWKSLFSADDLSLESHNIFIASHNCEGYYVHFSDISNNHLLNKADIVALQETWTTSDQFIQSALPHHNIKFRHRQTDSKGGVALLIHQDFDYTILDTSHIEIECIAVQITQPALIVMSVYRPPRLSVINFCQQMMFFLTTLPSNTPIVIAGDFNENLLKSPSKTLTDTFALFNQVITTPTTKRQTLIDHIYVKNMEIKASGTFPSYYSFHKVTFVILI